MPPRIDFTARDFDSIMLSLRNHLQSKFPNTWRNFYESGIGTSWLELVAYSYDILSFYLDYSANEAFLPTARDRESVIRLGKLVGYKLRLATGAAVTCTATLPAIQVVDVIVSAGISVETSKGVTFRTLAEQRIAAGSLTGELVFSEGELRSGAFTGTGASWQRLRLSETTVINDSISVVIDGTAWSELNSLVFANTASAAYQIEHGEDDSVYVLFGDGTNGQVPAAGANIVIAYRVGGGVQGNINLDEIASSVIGNLDGALPLTPVVVEVANDTYRGSGGEAQETTAHAKFWIPSWVTTNGRAVTENDFDTLANTFSDATYGTAAFAKSMLKQEIPELNTVQIYLWSRDSGGSITAPSQGLKDAVYAYFMNNGEGAVRIICTDVEVLDGLIVYIDVDVDVTVDSLFSATEVATSVDDALDELFESSETQPGTAFRISRAYDAIQDATGVDHALIDLITASYKSTEQIAIGNGVDVLFSVFLDLEPSLPMVASTVIVTAGTQVLTDDGEGILAGSGVGTVDYDTGQVVVTFTNPPANGQIVYVEYRHVIDYQRGELETTAPGAIARFEGVITYPPVVPWDPVTAQKGIGFSDGLQVVTDDGSGNLVGNVDPTGTNRINYATGAYDFTFTVAPAAGAEIRSTYRQMLRTPSEDIPVTEAQLTVKGTYTITTE